MKSITIIAWLQNPLAAANEYEAKCSSQGCKNEGEKKTKQNKKSCLLSEGLRQVGRQLPPAGCPCYRLPTLK